MRIAVDSHQPNLELIARPPLPDGSISPGARFDPLLVPESFQLEFQTQPDAAWQPLAVEPSNVQVSPNTITGSTSWQVTGTSRVILVRGEIRDRANNQASVTRRILVARPAAAVAPAATPAASQADAGAAERPEGGCRDRRSFGPRSTHRASASAGGTAPRRSLFTPQPDASLRWRDSLAGDPQHRRLDRRRASTDGVPSADEAGVTPPRGAIPQDVGPGGFEPASAGVTGRPTRQVAVLPDAAVGASLAAREVGAETQSMHALPDAPPPSSPVSPLDEPYQALASTLEPGVASHRPLPTSGAGQEAAASQADAGRNDTSQEEPLVGPRPRMTRSRRFNLAYDVEAIGASGVKRVELWQTTDGGRHWQKSGEDADRKMSFFVELEADGVYGFQIVIINGDGFAGRAPRSGDPAGLWVGVDTTAPQAKITSARYGSGEKAGVLDIRWTVEDAYLTDRPISLLFATSADGPWTPIASSLPNVGLYEWRVDARIPREVYLKLEARDESGNVSQHVLAEPINMDGLAPRARIRGFTPLEEARTNALQRWPKY